MDYLDYAKELIEYMVENEQVFQCFKHDVTEIARGECAVLIFLIDGHDGVNAREISKHFGINTSRVAAVLNNLSKKGFIQRVADLSDKRKIRVYITDTGREFGMQRRREIEKYFGTLLAQLGEKDAKEYLRLSRQFHAIVMKMKEEHHH